MSSSVTRKSFCLKNRSVYDPNPQQEETQCSYCGTIWMLCVSPCPTSHCFVSLFKLLWHLDINCIGSWTNVSLIDQQTSRFYWAGRMADGTKACSFYLPRFYFFWPVGNLLLSFFFPFHSRYYTFSPCVSHWHQNHLVSSSQLAWLALWYKILIPFELQTTG